MLGYSEVSILRAMHKSICRRCRVSLSLTTEDIDLPVVPENSVPELPLRAKPVSTSAGDNVSPKYGEAVILDVVLAWFGGKGGGKL